MLKTTTGSSGKTKEPYSKEVLERFDGMLDLISSKNEMIGRLTVELAEARDHFLNLIPLEVEPDIKRLIRLRVGKLDRFIKEALS